jgi:hypothetical protein
VNIRFEIIGLIHLDHGVNVINVDSTSSNIRGHENVHPTRSELLEVSGSPSLVEVTMKTDSRYSIVIEIVREVLRERSGPREHQHFARALGKLQNKVSFLTLVDDPYSVIDTRGLLVLTLDLKDRGVRKKLRHNVCNTGIESRREQQTLTLR